MELYTELFKKRYFVGVQPVTIDSDNFNPRIPYFITYKLDGARNLLLFSGNTNYTISSKMEFTPYFLPNKSSLYKNSVIDGEMYKGVFYAFDILFYNGNDLRNTVLTERLVFLKRLVEDIKSKKLILKKYETPYKNSHSRAGNTPYHSRNTCKNFFAVKRKFSEFMKLGGDIDGIILTPDSIYKTTVLKWKPVNLISIDFRINKIDNNRFELLLQNGEIFKPLGEHKDIGITTVPESIYKTYKNNSIAEFIFLNGKFIPIRERPDKTKPNHISVINSNFKQILKPLNIRKECEKFY